MADVALIESDAKLDASRTTIPPFGQPPDPVRTRGSLPELNRE